MIGIGHARAVAVLVAGAALALAGCESTSSSKAQPPPPAIPTPPPIQEAPAPYRAQLHAELAAGFFERGQMDVALQELETAMQLDPKNPKIYNVYGLVYSVLGEDAKAQTNFQTAIQLAPTDSEIRQNWGWFLCTHGRAKESIAEFDLAVRNPLYKTPDIALVNAGKCSVEIGDARRAEEYFKRALGVNPGSVTAAYNLALLLYREGRLDDARALIRRVVQLPAPGADALYLGMCIERKLGDRPSESSYVSQLRNRYPDSPEARAIPPGNCE
jgi:type IV pilus assembly protein PilF